MLSRDNLELFLSEGHSITHKKDMVQNCPMSLREVGAPRERKEDMQGEHRANSLLFFRCHFYIIIHARVVGRTSLKQQRVCPIWHLPHHQQTVTKTHRKGMQVFRFDSILKGITNLLTNLTKLYEIHKPS